MVDTLLYTPCAVRFFHEIFADSVKFIDPSTGNQITLARVALFCLLL